MTVLPAFTYLSGSPISSVRGTANKKKHNFIGVWFGFAIIQSILCRQSSLEHFTTVK
jgi:hypothetical protein